MEVLKYCYMCGKEQIFTDELRGKKVRLHCSYCGVNDWRNEEEKDKYLDKMMVQRWAW